LAEVILYDPSAFSSDEEGERAPAEGEAAADSVEEA
jgi:hypothetical protein